MTAIDGASPERRPAPSAVPVESDAAQAPPPTPWLPDWWPVLVVAATCAFLLVVLWPELSIGRCDLNDQCYHWPIVAQLADVLSRGGNPIDTWISQWTLGYAVPRTYQPLGHLVLALAHASVLRSVDLFDLFIWVRFLLLVGFPITIFASARILGLSAGAAAACSAIAPLLSTPGLYGLDLGSYAWRGSGLYTQLWAMHLLPFALAVSFRAMREGRRLWLAALLLSLTFAAHLVYGYIGALSVVMLAALPDAAVAPARRLVRLAVIGLLAGLCSLWLLLPLVQDAAIINNSRWEDAWKFQSVGPVRVLELALSGKLLDHGRLPVISLLAAAGLVAAAFSWRRAEAGVERFVLAGSILWLLLFAGRPLWGPLLVLIGIGPDVPLHRVIGGVHLFLVFAAGLGLWTVARLARDRLRAPEAFVAAACVLILLPVLRERSAWCAVNRKWGIENLSSWKLERADIDRVIEACRARNGRAYPGLAGTWGRDVKIGSVPLYSFLSVARVPTVAFLYHAMALTADTMVRFDDTRAEQYRVFGITTVVATDQQELPVFLIERERFGRFTVFDAPGQGYFDCVNVAASVACDRRTFHDIVYAWMLSDWPADVRYLALDLGARPPPDLPRLVPGAALPESRPELVGAVVSESREHETYSARALFVQPGWALFKMTYHPNWRFEVDGVAQPVVHVTPGFMAVRVDAGEHELRCEYVPGRARLLLLLLLAPGALVVGLVAERLHGVAALERALAARWISPGAWLLARPRLATALVLVGLTVPLCVPLLKGELTSGHDHHSYLPRLVEFHENVRHGILLPRWAPDLGSGHGQPLFVFAPPMLMAIAECWHLLGLDIVWSLNLALVALIVASAFTMYGFAAFHVGHEGGLLAAAAYVWAPYFASDLYVRHAAAEFSAFAFYPLALLGISRLAATGRGRDAVLAACGVAGVLLCHPPAALLFMPLAGAFALFESARRRSPVLLARQAGALALGLALSATAWLPALVERPHVKMERLLEGYLRYSNHFVHLKQLVWSRWGFGLSVLGPGDGMSYSLGLVQLVLAVVVIVLLVRGRSPLVGRVSFFAATTLAYALLMSTLAEPLWDRVELLQFVEFPWRALAPAAVALAFVVGALGPVAGSRTWIARLAMAVIVVSGLSHAWPQASEPFDASQWTADQIARRGLSVITKEEYEPRSVGERQPFTEERAAFVAGGGAIRDQEWTPERARMTASAAGPSTIELRTYHYPGWTAFVDGRESPITVAPVTGFMRVDLPAGEHDVVLRLLRTTAQRVALAMAAMALIGAAVIVARGRRGADPGEAGAGR